MSQPESRIVRVILAHLRASGAFCFKVHGSEYMMAGLPDIVGVRDGRFFGFEVKTPIGKASERQLYVLDLIKGAGGIAGVVRSVADVEALFKASERDAERA